VLLCEVCISLSKQIEASYSAPRNTLCQITQGLRGLVVDLDEVEVGLTVGGAGGLAPLHPGVLGSISPTCLRKAFTRIDPKFEKCKMADYLTVIFVLLGSRLTKAPHKRLMKLTPEVGQRYGTLQTFRSILENNFLIEFSFPISHILTVKPKMTVDLDKLVS